MRLLVLVLVLVVLMLATLLEDLIVFFGLRPKAKSNKVAPAEGLAEVQVALLKLRKQARRCASAISATTSRAPRPTSS
jgi:hypothetical protein